MGKSKNKSLNTIENVVSDESIINENTSISAELTHRLLHTIIDYQAELNGISTKDTLQAITDLNRELFNQLEWEIPEEKHAEMLDKVKELNIVLRDAVKEKYGNKQVDWFVMYYVCTVIQGVHLKQLK